MQPVSVRRVDRFRRLTLLQEDSVLFSLGGDAWLGRIQDESAEAGRPFKTLLAYRFAPVATFRTGNYTPAQQGAATQASISEAGVVTLQSEDANQPKQFLCRATRQHGAPRVITAEGYAPGHPAAAKLKVAGTAPCRVRVRPIGRLKPY